VAERVEQAGAGEIVYDPALLGQIDASIFDASLREGQTQVSASLAGRGSVAVVDVNGQDCILRHYYRGGMIRHVATDAFVWAGASRTRPFVEWRLLAKLWRLGLPVPQPVAARYFRHGVWYTADLITRRIAGVKSLATWIAAGPVAPAVWNDVGLMIRRFHDASVFHADLNAHNIQLADSGELYLLDFDRGRIMSGAGGWSARNLARLQRSLEKISQGGMAHFAVDDWQALMAGYDNSQSD
jgi:3-deoxy-D-manno-octulosonic acid kinase